MFLLFSDSMKCRICGIRFNNRTSTLVHAAICHNVLGDNFPSKEEIQEVNRRSKVKGPSKDQVVTSDVPLSKVAKPSQEKLGKTGVVQNKPVTAPIVSHKLNHRNLLMCSSLKISFAINFIKSLFLISHL